ncbi:ectopic P granules protein 5 homolog isoform X1 [Procambarus clarkii]|uniref:ectopic P granules protein 5 homolog isoform X1 n=1 Tax=Procambarus clarkii TaxID=6728 RepID=UPI0037424C47
MAEAVRKRKPRSRKEVFEKCPETRVQEEDGTENHSMLELLAEYGEIPLPPLETLDDGHSHDNGHSQPEEEAEHKDLSSQEISDYKIESAKDSESSQTFKNENSDVNIGEDHCSVKEKTEAKVKEITGSSSSDFYNLQQKLLEMEPYFKLQQQLKDLAIDDTIIQQHRELCNINVLPYNQIGCEYVQDVVNETSVDNSGVVVTGQCSINSDALASAPIFHDPKSSLDIPTESEISTEAQISGSVIKPGVKLKVTLTDDSAVQPMTDVQINALYQNNELEENDSYIAHFIEQERNTPQLEFYELVLGYLRARTSLIGSQKEVVTIQEEYKKQKGNVWIFEKRTTTEEGECEDGRLLTVKHEYDVACFKEEICTHVSKQLKQTRELLSDSYALHAYEAEMSKLQVENYMQKILSDCPDFMQIPKNAKIGTSSSREHKPHLRPHVDKLYICISVLFSFQRRGVKDQQFIRDTRQWLTDLVAILLRVATRHDHLFVLNHILRCPAGVGTWAPPYIQVGGSWTQEAIDGRGMLGCWPLDHSLTVLSTILSPVNAREDFLHHLQQTALPGASDGDTGSSEDKTGDNVWVVVDSCGEEEENPAQLWSLLSENDVVQILNQVPFKNIFQHILLVEEENGKLRYSVSHTSHHGCMKLFAFATRLIQLFRRGLATYSQLRYRGVTKRICRLLRHTMQYVTDHWQSFLSAHQDAPSQSSAASQTTVHLASLQVEYDQLFEKAVDSIFSSPRSGAWQFLAVIPYGSVSLSRLWKIVYKLHTGMREESLGTACKESAGNLTNSDWADLVTHSDTRGQFYDCLLKMEENESFYLLSALANMTAAREASEKEFIKVVIKNIFEATFVNEGTREELSRNGRDLLSTIAAKHPSSISFLLTATQEKITSVGGMALYLFRALPLEMWEPDSDDVTCVSHWLLFMPAASVENQLARIILSKLNWGENELKTQLSLPQELHRKVAITVLEAHIKICCDMYSGSLLTEGVKQVTSVMYSPSPEQVFFDWSWEMLSCLRLHRLDQPEAQVRATLASPSLLLEGMPDPTSVAITQGSLMNVVKRGIMDKNPLALFSALLLTTWGHSLPEFCEQGIECIHELVAQGRYEAAISALGHIMPLFFSQLEDITSSTRLMLAIQKCLTADHTYITMAKSLVATTFPGKILNAFAAMIVYHIQNYTRYNLPSGALAVQFWLQLLICVPEWVHDSSVLFLLDTICQHAFIHSTSWQEVLRGFSEVMKSSEYQCSAGGGVIGLLSWLTAGTTAPNSLLVRPSAPQFPWFTVAVLTLETQQEVNSGLWKNLLLELYTNKQTTLEQALKKVTSALGLGPASSSLLSIYRWGRQVVDLPADHPAFPVTLQMYLALHMARVPPQPGQYECGSVVSSFYQGIVNSAFLNKIKKKVASAVEHYESSLSKEPEDEEGTPDLQIAESVKLLRGMQAWLDETRLYEPGVYLPALPPHLLPQKLMEIFQGNWEPWPEAINQKIMEESAQKFLRVWEQHRCGKSCSSISGSPSASPEHRHKPHSQKNLEQYDPKQSIIKRLDTYEPPQPPPPIPPKSPLHTPCLQDKTLVDPEALLSLVHRYTDFVVEHAQAVNLWCNEMCALDCVYREVLPQLYTNTATKTILTAECQPPKVGRQQPKCLGPASIVVEFSEARLNERENARVEQNREQYEGVLQRCQMPPPLQLCQAAISLEAIITTLVNGFRKARTENNNNKTASLLASGRQLFYHIVQLTSDDTSFYPPAKQLITSCGQVLGQEFVRGHNDCQEALVAQVLEWGGQLGGLLAPHFTPAVVPIRTFLTLYSSLSPHASLAPDHTFMLLSKFDIENWISNAHPNSSEQTELINAVGTALSSLLQQSHTSLLVVLELYRVHLRILLNYKFPDHYTEVLGILLHISSTTQEDCGGFSTALWYDLINTLSVGICHFSPDMDRMALIQAIRDFAQHQSRLSQSMVDDTLKMLSSYFVNQRLEFGLYGLYPKYQLHIQPISVFLSLISHTYIVTTFHTSWGAPQDEIVREVWAAVESLWAGWVAPLGGHDRQSFPAWLRHLTHDIRLLLPWAPSDTSSADIMVAMFCSSLEFMHEHLPGSSSVLSLTLEYYSVTFAMREVKSHVLVAVHNHLSALPWHHFHPSLQDTLIFSKVVEQYLPECHSFIGGVLVQINWSKVLQAILTAGTAVNYTQPPDLSHKDSSQEANPTHIDICDSSQPAAKMHTCLLNLLVRISMEPSIRQSPLLQTLLLEAEMFSWWLVDGNSFQRVVNWWVMSCDPRIVLTLPDRNPVDIAIIDVLHRAAGYTPDTSSFHQDTAAKRGLLVRALVRLLTSAAARHKVLLSAKPHVFAATIHGLLTHMENTLITTVPKDQQWSEGGALSTEVLALVSGGASSAALQELASSAVVTWLLDEHHPSPGLLLPLLASASRTVLHLKHRNPILQAGLTALFRHADWSGWEREVTWERVVSVLSFPLTNPTAMLNLAAQECHLLVVYAHTCWRRQHTLGCGDLLLLLTFLCEMLETLTLNAEMENGLVLLLSEVLKIMTHLLQEKGTTEPVWQHCQALTSQLALWAEDRATTGILAAIGLGRQSPLSAGVRLLCRTLGTFLKLQMPREGVFRTHPLHTHSDVDGSQSSVGSETCTLEQLRSLRTNASYAGLAHPLTQAIQFIEDPAHCLPDVHILLARLVADILPDPVLHHLTVPFWGTVPSAPPQSPHDCPEHVLLSDTTASAPPS